jgi:hypothetical protein
VLPYLWIPHCRHVGPRPHPRRRRVHSGTLPHPFQHPPADRPLRAPSGPRSVMQFRPGAGKLTNPSGTPRRPPTGRIPRGRWDSAHEEHRSPGSPAGSKGAVRPPGGSGCVPVQDVAVAGGGPAAGWSQSDADGARDRKPSRSSSARVTASHRWCERLPNNARLRSSPFGQMHFCHVTHRPGRQGGERAEWVPGEIRPSLGLHRPTR